MNQRVGSDEARRALAEVRGRQGQVIDAALVPVRYWWAVAALTVGLAAAVDSGQALAIGIALPVFVISVVGVSVPLVYGTVRHPQVHGELLGDRGALVIGGFVFVLVGPTLGIAFGLQAAGVRYPATLACLVAAAVMVVGGPALMGALRRIMLDNRAERLG
jgi:hypothetical protein